MEILVTINFKRAYNVQNKSEKLAVNVGIYFVVNPGRDGETSSEGAFKTLR